MWPLCVGWLWSCSTMVMSDNTYGGYAIPAVVMQLVYPVMVMFSFTLLPGFLWNSFLWLFYGLFGIFYWCSSSIPLYLKTDRQKRFPRKKYSRGGVKKDRKGGRKNVSSEWWKNLDEAQRLTLWVAGGLALWVRTPQSRKVFFWGNSSAIDVHQQKHVSLRKTCFIFSLTRKNMNQVRNASVLG